MLSSGSLTATKAEDMSKKASVLGENAALSARCLVAPRRVALQGCTAQRATARRAVHMPQDRHLLPL